MILVGLTGGIGSGKTTVAHMFKDLGIPIFIADDEAKYLMNNSKVVRRKLIGLFGDNTYLNNKLNKPYLAKCIFNDKELLKKMNAIIHPKVSKRFLRWTKKQQSPYVISEAAILFENGSYKNYDYIITVTAPKDKKIKRVLKRDNTSKEKVLKIMSHQWSDTDKINLSDFVIENITLENTKKEVLKIHNHLKTRSQDL